MEDETKQPQCMSSTPDATELAKMEQASSGKDRRPAEETSN